jgi:hypothetical protein
MCERDEQFGKECAIRLQAGRDLAFSEFETGKYDLCLSHSQARTLFPHRGDGKEIGRGAAAVVFTRGANAVVKITRDPDDVSALQLGQGLPHVAKIGRVFRLVNAARDADTGRFIPIYAVVVERVRKPTIRKLGSWASERGPMPFLRNVMKHEAAAWDGPNRDFRLSPEGQVAIRSACEDYGPNYPHLQACTRFATSFAKTWRDLYRRGVYWADVHKGNVGEDARGVWKAIDLGFSDTKQIPRAVDLRGLARAGRELAALYGQPKTTPLR